MILFVEKRIRFLSVCIAQATFYIHTEEPFGSILRLRFPSFYPISPSFPPYFHWCPFAGPYIFTF
jgi:hypothetical protein